MADDNLETVYAELQKVRDFAKLYDANTHRFDGTFGHIIRAIEHLTAEVEALREERA